MKAIEKFN